MSGISAGLKLSWRIAAIEASHTGNAFIEPVHLFLGVCSLEKFTHSEGAADSEGVAEEATALDRVLRSFQLTAEDLRREARGRGGCADQGPAADSSRIMHRSLASKAAFIRAANFSGRITPRAVTSLDLAAALLHDEEGIIAAIFSERRIRERNLLQEALLRAAELLQLPAITPRQSAGPKAAETESFCTDLTALAREGLIHECVGRDAEMLRLVQTLSRETKNNPLLIGDPGVGKTAIVEGLAWRIVQGKDAATRGKRLIQLSLAGLVGGTRFRGDLEERIERLLRQVAGDPHLLLFIDEIHGVLSGDGPLSIANLLKPALARGELRCIGATTWDAYRRFIQSDPALERRFQTIQIEEPSVEATRRILDAGFRARLETKHRVRIEPSAIAAAAALSAQYLADRRLPDKAIDLLDETCARVAVPKLGSDALDASRVVNEKAVAETLATQTGIPLAQLSGDERARLLGMTEALRSQVIGQDAACQKVAQMIQRARIGLKARTRPAAVLLFVGSTGVGKTELAKALARQMFGSETALTRLDMSEYAERHTVSRLIGAPPGFIGHDEEPQLTGALQRHPFCVVLIDEVEKAHMEVLNLFLQLFDEGRLTDAKGRTADATNAVFILTSNIMPTAQTLGFGAGEVPEARLAEALRAVFTAELLNRVDAVIPFRRLDETDLAVIARLLLEKLRQKLHAQRIELRVKEDAIAWLAQTSCDPCYGARQLRRIIEQSIEGEISDLMLHEKLTPGDLLVIGAGSGGLSFEVEHSAAACGESGAEAPPSSSACGGRS